MLGYTIVGLQTPFLKQLVSVDFTRLEKLEIIRCKIESLEPLSWLDAPNFKTVYLSTYANKYFQETISS